jgi:predicted membrane channel-forming protein YqfA (hemolysin III family)
VHRDIINNVNTVSRIIAYVLGLIGIFSIYLAWSSRDTIQGAIFLTCGVLLIFLAWVGYKPVQNDGRTKIRKIYIVLAYLSFLLFLPSLAIPFDVSQLGCHVVPFIFISDVLALFSGLASLVIRARTPKEGRSNVALTVAVLGVGGAILTIGIDAFMAIASLLCGATAW